MSELTNVFARNMRDLTTPTSTGVNPNTFDNAKIPIGNAPKGFESTEALTVKQLKDLATSDLEVALSNLSTTANKFYPTLSEANSHLATMSVNDVVTIGEGANKGLWYKATANATTLIKSAYDPLTQANNYTNNKTSITKTEAVATANNYTDLVFDAFPAVIAPYVAQAEAAATAATISAGVFETPEAGVDPVTGVEEGEYFNVRSPSSDSYIDEYQNAGGSAVPTGKSYLSALGVQQQEKPANTIKDASGLSQQEVNDARAVAVDSIADLLALPEGQRKEGLRYIVKGYYAGSDVGGGEFYYNPERSGDNDGGIVLNGFIRVIVGPLSPAHFGATVSKTPQNQAIQAALSSYHHVQIDEPYWVDATNMLSMSSNQIVDFVGDGKLTALPNSAGSYSILALRGIENSTLNHPVIQGDKYTHTGTTGEWGNCLDIRSVKKVTVNNPVLTDAWGDCLYIGRNDLPSENLVINNPICQRGRRQGISLIAGVGVTINNPVCEDIRSDDSSVSLAAGPHAGIDIEPNTYLDRLDDIRIIDPTTRRCKGRGLLVAITAITKDQPENHYANVGISVVRHIDEGSVGGVEVAYAGFGRLKGYVVLDSPTYRDSMRSALSLRVPDKSVKVTVVRPVIIDHNRIGGTSSNYDTAVFVGVVDQSYDGDMGGMHIINPKIVVNTPTATSMYGITVRNVNHPNRRIGVDIEDIEYWADERLTNYVSRAARGLFTSKDNSLYSRLSASATLNDQSGQYVEGVSETLVITLTLIDRPYGHPDLHIRRTSLTQNLNVVKPAEGTLWDMDGTPLTGMRTRSQYAYVQLRPLGDGAWMIVSRYGSWEIWAKAAPAIASVTYNPPSLTNGTQQATTVTLTGAKLGDNINVSFDKPLSGTRMWGEVTSINTVTVYHRNDTGNTVDVVSGTLKVKLV